MRGRKAKGSIDIPYISLCDVSSTLLSRHPFFIYLAVLSGYLCVLSVLGMRPRIFDTCLQPPAVNLLRQSKLEKLIKLKQTLPPCHVCSLCRREEAIRAIEEEIRRERRVADEVIQAMPAAKQDKYFTMTRANEELLQVLMEF